MIFWPSLLTCQGCLLGFVRLVARTLGCASLLLAAAEASLRLKTTTLPDRLRGVRALRLMHRMLLRGMYRASWWARFYHRLICHREIRVLIRVDRPLPLLVVLLFHETVDLPSVQIRVILRVSVRMPGRLLGLMGWSYDVGRRKASRVRRNGHVHSAIARRQSTPWALHVLHSSHHRVVPGSQARLRYPLPGLRQQLLLLAAKDAHPYYLLARRRLISEEHSFPDEKWRVCRKCFSKAGAMQLFR